MGRELQKKKNRSGIAKARPKQKSKKKLLHHPVVAAEWDQTQTLEQNYKRLGLTAKLNKHTGGVEKKTEDVVRAREEADADPDGGRTRKDDPLAVESLKRPEKLVVQEAKIERDPETGKILRVVESGQVKANPLNDPLAELDSDEEGGFNQHASTILMPRKGTGAQSAVVQKLEEEASRPKAKWTPKQSDAEKAFIAELVKKHGDDYHAMERDMKINYNQRSAGDLKRRVKKWKESGGTLD